MGWGLVRGAEDSHPAGPGQEDTEGHIAAGLPVCLTSPRLFLLYSVGHSSYPWSL